jgi:hypothetical protein
MRAARLARGYPWRLPGWPTTCPLVLPPPGGEPLSGLGATLGGLLVPGVLGWSPGGSVSAGPLSKFLPKTKKTVANFCRSAWRSPGSCGWFIAGPPGSLPGRVYLVRKKWSGVGGVGDLCEGFPAEQRCDLPGRLYLGRKSWNGGGSVNDLCEGFPAEQLKWCWEAPWGGLRL